MKKIIFGITSLTLGGAERVLVDIVNNLKNDYDITIFTLYPNGEFEKAISSNVKIIGLYSKQYKKMTKIEKLKISLKLFFRGKSIYNKHIKQAQYDTEIAFLEGPITRLFSNKNINVKKIAWVHNDISKVFGNSIKAKLKEKYDRKVYSKYDKIVFVSKDNLEKFADLYKKISRDKLKLIYNYIDAENVKEKSNFKLDVTFEKDKLNFITVARLTKQKAIDRLLKVHINLIKNGFIHNIYMIGEGPEKEALEQMVKDNNVSSTFKILGKRENPYPYIKNADVFCLLSAYEGYGMVIEEAKILDKFIIITDTAAREALNGYSNSVIVDNSEEGIYNGLKQIIEGKVKYEVSNKCNVYNNVEILEEIKYLL